MRYFVRTKGQDAFVESETLKEAFVRFVEETPLELLGAILIAHTEYFPQDNVPADAIAIRTTIPLVEAGIWTREQAQAFDEAFKRGLQGRHWRQ